jgi:hypothetical protein
MSTTKTVKMIPSGVSDRYAYAYGYLSGCMRNVEYAAQQIRLRDDPEWVALWVQEIRREIASYKALDDALHNEHD